MIYMCGMVILCTKTTRDVCAENDDQSSSDTDDEIDVNYVEYVLCALLLFIVHL